MKQPMRAAVQIIRRQDHRHGARRIPIKLVTKATANTIPELAQKLEIDVEGLGRARSRNSTRGPAGKINPSGLTRPHTGHQPA